MSRILIIEDDTNLRRSIALFLAEKGYEVNAAATAAEGLALLTQFQPRVIILDVKLPDASGLEILPSIKQNLSGARVIVITAHHDMETTIEAMRSGAFEYLHKPLDIDELEKCVEDAAHIPEVGDAAAILKTGTGSSGFQNQLVGNSRGTRQIFKNIGLLTRNRATVLIEGQTGTGKEVIARVIHERSPWANEPFITVDCTTLVDNLIESELFGHEKGAFTGATSSKLGRLEKAGQGTIFFDEIGELSLRLQAKLLRFLERREFSRVGGVETMHSEARIIGATNRSLDKMAAEGSFRTDLLYRLKVTRIKVPALCTRIEDLDEMVPFFLRRINHELRMDVGSVEKGAMALLKDHSWPGNVRELINVLTKAAIDSKGEVLLSRAVKNALTLGAEAEPRGNDIIKTLEEVESHHIVKTLGALDWNISAAARALGVSRATLRSRMVKHGIQRPSD
jgi:two-component system response regulator AtoC